MYLEQGNKIRKFRENSHDTLSKVAKKIGVTINYLSLIERGERKPSEVVMYGLADYFGLNPVEIFSLYGTVPTEQLDRIISSPSLVKILSNISCDNSFTEEEKEEITEALQKEVEKLLQKRGDKNNI